METAAYVPSLLMCVTPLTNYWRWSTTSKGLDDLSFYMFAHVGSEEEAGVTVAPGATALMRMLVLIRRMATFCVYIITVCKINNPCYTEVSQE